MKMNEGFLHHLWKLKLFNQQDLETTQGEPLEIIRTGQHNSDAGPDFFNAQVKIAETWWAGNVEIHVRSSDWENHSHEKDKAYDTIILHVVFEHDKPVKRNDGSLIPTLELKNKFNERLWRNYEDLLHSSLWIPCQSNIQSVDKFTF